MKHNKKDFFLLSIGCSINLLDNKSQQEKNCICNDDKQSTSIIMQISGKVYASHSIISHTYGNVNR